MWHVSCLQIIGFLLTYPAQNPHEVTEGRNSIVLGSAPKTTLTSQLTAEKSQAPWRFLIFITLALHFKERHCKMINSELGKGAVVLCTSSRNALCLSYILWTLTVQSHEWEFKREWNIIWADSLNHIMQVNVSWLGTLFRIQKKQAQEGKQGEEGGRGSAIAVSNHSPSLSLVQVPCREGFQ